MEAEIDLKKRWGEFFNQGKGSEILDKIRSEHELDGIAFANARINSNNQLAFIFEIFTEEPNFKDWNGVIKTLTDIAKTESKEKIPIAINFMRGVMRNAQWEDVGDITKDQSGPDPCGLGGDA